MNSHGRRKRWEKKGDLTFWGYSRGKERWANPEQLKRLIAQKKSATKKTYWRLKSTPEGQEKLRQRSRIANRRPKAKMRDYRQSKIIPFKVA
jgi:hypothetical protein